MRASRADMRPIGGAACLRAAGDGGRGVGRLGGPLRPRSRRGGLGSRVSDSPNGRPGRTGAGARGVAGARRSDHSRPEKRTRESRLAVTWIPLPKAATLIRWRPNSLLGVIVAREVGLELPALPMWDGRRRAVHLVLQPLYSVRPDHEDGRGKSVAYRADWP